MILIGMFDSPFVRRVAVSASLLGFTFEHRNWSVGRDFERIREFSPLGRVPVLVLDAGDALVESAEILDWLDQQIGPARALLPASGEPRRRALHVLALATGAIEKGIAIVMERVFRPEDKRHEPWVERCRLQAHGALAELERLCAASPDGNWLLGEAMSQADVTLACYATYLAEAVPIDLSAYPALMARVAGCEALDVFRRYHVPFHAPTVSP